MLQFLKHLWDKRPFRRGKTVYIYMKSGNVIPIDGVANFKTMNEGDDVVSIEVSYARTRQRRGEARPIMRSIALSQIEGVGFVK